MPVSPDLSLSAPPAAAIEYGTGDGPADCALGEVDQVRGGAQPRKATPDPPCVLAQTERNSAHERTCSETHADLPLLVPDDLDSTG